MQIRAAVDSDFDDIWTIIQEVVQTPTTYAIDPKIDKAAAHQLWMTGPQATFVAVLDNTIAGTYYLKANQQGPGDHVCNCGYMVASSARGQGLATALCEHSQRTAVQLGYQAMQFNFVVASNTGAIRLWVPLKTLDRASEAHSCPTARREKTIYAAHNEKFHNAADWMRGASWRREGF